MYSNITNESITSFANRMGYYQYIPYDLIRDIISCHYYETFYGNYKLYYTIQKPYANDLIDLMDSVYIDPDMSGPVFAINLLKSISHRVNLRSIGDKGIVYETEHQFNYDVDLLSFDSCVQELLDINESNYNSTELSDDILNILRKTNGITIGCGFDKVSVTTKNQMKHYESLVRVSSTARCMPDFTAKFVQKQLLIKQPDYDYISKNEKILAIDISASIDPEVVEQSIYTGAIILASHFKNVGFTLDLLLFGNDIYYSYKVTSIQQLKEICKLPHKDITYRNSWRNTANKIFNTYHGKEIVIITDGTEENIYANKWSNNTIHCISDTKNDKLSNLCKRTNGKFFIK